MKQVSILKILTLDSRESDGLYLRPKMEPQKNAQELNRLRNATLTEDERSEIAKKGGLAGGPARAAKLTKKRRRAIAKKAAAARWGKKP